MQNERRKEREHAPNTDRGIAEDILNILDMPGITVPMNFCERAVVLKNWVRSIKDGQMHIVPTKEVKREPS